MRMRKVSFVVSAGWLVAGMAAAIAVAAAGFDSFQQGAKAAGMAGAFTAQADDPSAMFHNLGGLGMFEGREFYAGGNLIFLGDSTFRGLEPFPGSGQTGEQVDKSIVTPHFYWVEPVGAKVNFGLAINSPFSLKTEWADADQWAGRYLSTEAELQALDLNPALGYRLSDKASIAFGVIARFSTVELARRVPLVDPTTGLVTDIAEAELKGDIDAGYGFNLGFLHRPTNRFSWGVNYRSELDVDYAGTARFTRRSSGNPILDLVVEDLLPFGAGTAVETSIDFPDQAFVGAAFGVNDRTLLEIDVVWTGWSSFEELAIAFPEEPSLDQTTAQRWDDVLRYNLGIRCDLSQRSQLRFGYYFDESPQPEATTGPLRPDADRNGFSFGYGFEGEKLQSDLYILWINYDDRTTVQPVFSGTYETNEFLLGVTFGWGSGRKS